MVWSQGKRGDPAPFFTPASTFTPAPTPNPHYIYMFIDLLI